MAKPPPPEDKRDLFSASLLHPVPISPNFVIRPLRRDDFDRGYMKLLAQLTSVGKVTKEQFERRFDELQQTPGIYYIIVVEDVFSKNVVGSGTLVIEPKFIHNCGKSGHLEDIVVDSEHRGNQLGRYIIEQLKLIAHHAGCYKCLLDCSEKNVNFYEKCDFAVKDLQMVHYFTTNASRSAVRSRL
mmetsp:Transcript_32588/g.81680  ORF Transcript_32588/g.81680 Transcript_32588/m.81680 type:complete len:185 (+) Transcript_32588:164-718(+)|eukprot:CAMPEP_0174248704 /NCGR_PEP_ID=MMETSP0417-20130205/43212_1 /TAXON_ID=242541 /ORGANISM="Mayorella sp, Strain BSH-02190019" /LENGTH=184 /DNA_ID=CAMNT_0015328571 /DNA_START=156 /DNA_END=710 /DNA_ORIENTATION=+